MILNDKEKALGWEISTAHEWLQKLPTSANLIICRDCRMVTKTGQWDVKPCHEHIVQGDLRRVA